jgi:lipoprotein-releasing system permease protein
MIDRFSLSVAVRGLLDSRRLTLLTVAVVGVSVVLVVFLTSLINGLQVKLVEDVTGAIAHVTVEPEERQPVAVWEREPEGADGKLYLGERTGYTRQKRKLEDWKVWLERIEETAAGLKIVTPTVRDQGFVVRGQTRLSARILGVRPREYNAIVDIDESLVDGRFARLPAGEVALGEMLAGELKVGVGDRVQVTPPGGKTVSMRVGGLYSTGFGGLDGATVFMNLDDAQSLFGLGSAVSSIDLKLTDVFAADEVAEKLSRQVPYDVTSWTEDNAQLLSALEAQRGSSNLIVFFAALAAAFAVASILVVLVTNKLREIGILKAIGASRRQVRTIFALQGTLLSFFGSVVGAGLGGLLVFGLSTLERSNVAGPPEPLFPFDLTWTLVLSAIGVASLVGFLASLIPARRAAKVQPIDVIRGL